MVARIMNKLVQIIFISTFFNLCYSQTNDKQSSPEQEEDLPGVFYEAEILETFPPVYPKIELNDLREGWVLLSYVITEEGKTADVIVQDSSGGRHFEDAAVAAVEKFTFSPARQDGKNVEQCSNDYIIRFRIEPPVKASHQFIYHYKQLAGSLQKGKLDKATEDLEKLSNLSQISMYEDSWLWWAHYLYAKSIDDDEKRYTSLLRSVSYDGDFLPEEIQTHALAELFIGHLTRMKVTEAMKIFEKLKKAKGADPYIETLQPYVKSLEDQIASGRPLLVNGNTQSRSIWEHNLFRSKVKVDNISGTLNRYELRCDKKRQLGDVVAGHAIDVPKNWGECKIVLHGDKNTSFDLYELAN